MAPAPGGISATRDDDLPVRGNRRSGGNSGRGGGSEGGGSSAGLGVGGWFVMNQQQLLTAAQAEQQAAESRLQVLEERLRATDEVMSDTGDATKEKLGYWETEIRKVWDIAYKVNRGWIKENQELLATHKSTLTTLQSGVTALKKDLASQGEGVTDLGERLEALDELSAKISGLTAGQDKLAKNIANIDVSALTERVLRNEQAVSAIDAYRVQLNRRLTDLQSRLDALGPVAGGASP